MEANASPVKRFKGWFIKPIEKLKKLPEGDGAFAAMMIVLPLYERYTVAKLKLNGQSTNDDDVRAEMAKDLNLDDDQRRIFYDMFRNGFMHQAMPKNGRTKWAVSSEFTESPEFKTIQGQSYVCLDPWKFARRVLNKFKQDPRLMDDSNSFPFADVFSLPV